MSQGLILHPEAEIVRQQREAFSKALWDFASNTDSSPSDYRPKFGPARYAYAPALFALDDVCLVIVQHPKYLRSFELMIHAVLKISGNSTAGNIGQPIWETCKAYAPAAQNWARQKQIDKELDKSSAKKAVLDAETFMVQYQAKCDTLLGLLKTEIHNPAVELASIEAATDVLKILLYHTSLTVETAVDRLSAPKTAAVVKWTAAATTSAVFGVGAVATAAFMPLLAIPIVCGAAGASCGWSITAAIDAGNDLLQTKRLCKEAVDHQKNIESNIKAFCLMMCFVYNWKANMQHMNDKDKVEKMEQLSAGLFGTVAEWHKPETVSQYIDQAGAELATDLRRLKVALSKLKA